MVTAHRNARSFIENGLAGDRFGGNEGGTRQKTPAEKGVY